MHSIFKNTHCTPIYFFCCCLVNSVAANLVVEGPNGLVYTPYANEGQSNAVNTVPDYSRAGYKGGGVGIPFIPAAITLEDDGSADDTARIQAAIDDVADNPIINDPVIGDYRGAILLKAGTYTVSDTLNINASGVIIRGEGQGTGGTIINYIETVPVIIDNNNRDLDLFKFQGSGNPQRISGSETLIADAYVPVGAKSFNINSTAPPYAPGDLIRITNLMNQKWVDDIGMTVDGGLTGDDEDPVWDPNDFQIYNYRYVVSVEPSATNPGSESTITLDAPIVQTIETQYGGGKVEKYTYNGAISNVGIENIQLVSAYDLNNLEDENHGWQAVVMLNVFNGWVRQVTSRHFGYGLVTIDNASMFITVEDSACLDPISVTDGGRKYSFFVDDSPYHLFQRCLTRGGRHDYVSGSRTPGPNVFVDSLATESNSDIGPHFKYATGQLYDNIQTDDEINVRNRLNSGTSHGWSGAQIMFWNIEAEAVTCDAPTGAMNWSIGTVGAKIDSGPTPDEPFGIWQSEGTHVTPRSLYYAQLEERLGTDGLQAIILPQQRFGTIWTELEAWDGDGLLLDPLVVWSDESVTPEINTAIPICGIVRDLRMLDSSHTYSWSRLSGPGTVVFGNSSAKETTVTFNQSGAHLLQLTVDGGNRQISATLRLTIAQPGDVTPPSAPTGLTLNSDSTVISLNWNDNLESDLSSYNLYRSTISGSIGEILATNIYESQYVDTTAEFDVVYYYTIRAIDANGNASTESTVVAGSLVTPLSVTVETISNAYAYASDGGTTPDSEDTVAFKNKSWGAGSRFSYFRFPLSSNNKIGFKTTDQLNTATLNLYVTVHEAGDTLYVYGLVDAAQYAPTTESETSWTGGSNGTAPGNNLSSITRPDGQEPLPNALTTALLGSYTFTGSSDNADTGLKQIELSLNVFNDLIDNDTNGEITLIASSEKNSAVGRIASLYNRDGNPVPSLTVTSGAPTGLVATGGSWSVYLDWNDNQDADFTSFSVFRKLLPEDDFSLLASGIAASEYTDYDVQNETTYRYVVYSYDTQLNESNPSDEVVATPTAVDVVSIPATDNSFIKKGEAIQDAEGKIQMKRSDWGNSAQLSYIRFPLSNLFEQDPAKLSIASLGLFVTNYMPGNTINVFGLIDSAESSPGVSLAEDTWTGGSDGTAAGGNNLQSNNKPDGDFGLPNTFTTQLLGSFTLGNVGDSEEVGLREITISNLDSLMNLIKNDTNNEITLILSTTDNSAIRVSSVFNTNGNPIPTLTLNFEEPDTDNDGLADVWEIQNFSRIDTSDGAVDSDLDGVADFFEYLYGSNPRDRASTGFKVGVSSSAGSDEVLFDWEVSDRFTLNDHYRVEVSFDLDEWVPLEQTPHTIVETLENGMNQTVVEIDDTKAPKAFIRLARP